MDSIVVIAVLYIVFLILGHAGGYVLVRFTRARRLNDFVALGSSCAALFVFGVADAFLQQWYIHAAGFGIVMGTVIFLSSSLGKDES